MREPSGRFRFLDKSIPEILVIGEVRMHDFQSDGAVKTLIRGSVHGGHSTARNAPCNPVPSVDYSTDNGVTDLMSHVTSVGDSSLALAEGTPWHNENVSIERKWLTLKEIEQRTGLPKGKVRRLVEDHVLPAIGSRGDEKVPEDFLEGDTPRSDVRGTFMVLLDAGFSNEEAMQWFLETEDSLGVAPIDALMSGRKAEVRRVAQALA